MSLTDYAVSALLVFSVVRQFRGRRLTAVGLLWPLAIVVLAAVEYLHGIPTTGHDLAVTVAGAVIGVILGTSCGLATAVRPAADGTPVATAGLVAAILWIVGVLARAGFAGYAANGGGAAIAAWSRALGITSGETWAAALILMALGEVVGRTVVLGVRAQTVRSVGQPERATA